MYIILFLKLKRKKVVFTELDGSTFVVVVTPVWPGGRLKKGDCPVVWGESVFWLDGDGSYW